MKTEHKHRSANAFANFKALVKPFVPATVLSMRQLWKNTRPLHRRSCPICGYYGKFALFGRPPRLDALCRRCESLERHRLFWLWFDGDRSKLTEPILHFAPEPVLRDRLRGIYDEYRTADLFNDADLAIDIERIDLGSNSLGTIICNHVLEHVSDRKALHEIYRVLSPGGKLICSVPLVEGWRNTYENDSVKTSFERELHFGQHDHVRFYGRDFRDRLRETGFSKIEEVTAEGEAVVAHSLSRGEKFFICSKH